MLQDPFDVIDLDDLAVVCGEDSKVVHAVIAEYRKVVQEALRGDCVVLTPDDAVLGHPGDPFRQFVMDASEADLVEIDFGDDLIEVDAAGDEWINFDRISQGIPIDDGEHIAYAVLSWDAALMVPNSIAGDRILVDSFAAASLTVNRLAYRDVSVSLERVDGVIVTFWRVAFATLGNDIDVLLGQLAAERHIEDWLADNLARLEAWVGPLTLEKRQLRLDDGRSRLDLLGRTPPGDWVVIEVKRGVAGPAALDQLDRYRELVRREIAQSGELVMGVIVSDGTAPSLRALLDERADVQRINLAWLEYPTDP